MTQAGSARSALNFRLEGAYFPGYWQAIDQKYVATALQPVGWELYVTVIFIPGWAGACDLARQVPQGAHLAWAVLLPISESKSAF